MQFSGAYDFSAPRGQVWQALNDSRVLQATIPGCEDLVQDGPQDYRANLRLKFGFLSFRTQGTLRVEVQHEAQSYRLYGQSMPTLFGSGQGRASVHLADRDGGGTHLTYDVAAQLEGRLAQLGAALVSGQIQRLGDRFFARFEAAMMEISENSS